MASQLVNAFGLVLDIVGAIILFKYGFPQPGFPEGDFLMLEQSETTRNKSREEKERYTRISQAGLVLLIVGFIFQLVGTWL